MLGNSGSNVYSIGGYTGRPLITGNGNFGVEVTNLPTSNLDALNSWSINPDVNIFDNKYNGNPSDTIILVDESKNIQVVAMPEVTLSDSEFMQEFNNNGPAEEVVIQSNQTNKNVTIPTGEGSHLAKALIDHNNPSGSNDGDQTENAITMNLKTTSLSRNGNNNSQEGLSNFSPANFNSGTTTNNIGHIPSKNGNRRIASVGNDIDHNSIDERNNTFKSESYEEIGNVREISSYKPQGTSFNSTFNNESITGFDNRMKDLIKEAKKDENHASADQLKFYKKRYDKQLKEIADLTAQVEKIEQDNEDQDKKETNAEKPSVKKSSTYFVNNSVIANNQNSPVNNNGLNQVAPEQYSAPSQKNSFTSSKRSVRKAMRGKRKGNNGPSSGSFLKLTTTTANLSSPKTEVEIDAAEEYIHKNLNTEILSFRESTEGVRYVSYIDDSQKEILIRFDKLDDDIQAKIKDRFDDKALKDKVDDNSDYNEKLIAKLEDGDAIMQAELDRLKAIIQQNIDEQSLIRP